jgi:endonuclease-3
MQIEPHNEIIEVLKSRSKELLEKPRTFFQFSRDPDADSMLNNLEEHPHAFVLACLMDRQIRAERAWVIPFIVGRETGCFKFAEMLTLTLEQIRAIFHERSLHRFNDKMANIFYAALLRIHGQYADVASNIWTNTPRSATVVKRFLQFKGAGVKIATMATNILVRRFKIQLSDLTCIDISPDVQVKRVFQRTGFLDKDSSIEELIYTARELNPPYPGIFDLACWEIGRNWCKSRMPQCDKCYLNDLCPKIL